MLKVAGANTENKICNEVLTAVVSLEVEALKGFEVSVAESF